jgi:hypothetical protein
MNKIKLSLILLSVAAVFASCEDREPLSWNTEIFLPLVDDNITWSSSIPDSLLEFGEGGEPARMLYKIPFGEFSADYLPTLPDTLIEENMSMEGNLPSDVPVPLGDLFVNETDEIVFSSFGEGSEAYLKELTLSAGNMRLSVESSVEGILDMAYYLNSVTVDGVMSGIELAVPAAQDGVNGFATETIDLAGAIFNLSGENGLSENVMTSTFTTTGSALNTEVFYLTTTDSMLVEIELIDLTIETAKGYFGQVEIPFDSEGTLIDTITIPNPVLDLEGASAKLTIDNYIGADLRLKFDEVSMDDQLLEHPSLFGVHDVARAYWNDETLINHTSLELDLGETGSNIFDLIETFPSDLAMFGSVQLNPFGDVSLGHDYINNAYPPKLELELEIPLKLGLDGVVLEEVYIIDPMDFPKFDGRLLVDLTSTFPVEVIADIDYVVNDEDGTIVSISGNIDAGSAYPEVSQHGLLVIPLNEETVSPGGSVYVSLTASTEGAVTFTGYENVRVQIRIEGTQLIEVD